MEEFIKGIKNGEDMNGGCGDVIGHLCAGAEL